MTSSLDWPASVAYVNLRYSEPPTMQVNLVLEAPGT